ncbi:MAG: glycosyltransferase family 2 protein [Gammaproteobacteria bacterium]|nr:glycosyltransferase family 2 protein [Gammaproteobacteria bacterium]
MPKKLISIVLPVYNEEDNIPACYTALCRVAEDNDQYDFEFVFTDNCSVDSSYSILQALSQKDERLHCYSFSRNFGYQKSIYTGLSKTKGDAAIIFDCDLQDPVDLFPEFLDKWEEGYKVVYGIRKQRNELRIIEWQRKLFYRIINSLSDDYIPPDAGDFRLIDRCIIDLLRNVNDHNPYLRGLISNFGFKQIGIPYVRNKRVAGKSKFNFFAMLRLAIDGIVSQSAIPLRFATYTGIIISLLTVFGIAGYLIGKTLFGATWPAGFTTTTILILLSLFLNAMFLGIIGEYLARIYNQVRVRPLSIIEKSTAEE